MPVFSSFGCLGRIPINRIERQPPANAVLQLCSAPRTQVGHPALSDAGPGGDIRQSPLNPVLRFQSITISCRIAAPTQNDVSWRTLLGLWTTNETFTCTGCGGIGVISPPDAGNFNTEIYGTFLQSNYSFGATVLPDRLRLTAEACSPVVMRLWHNGRLTI